jgi:hypothetical protein
MAVANNTANSFIMVSFLPQKGRQNERAGR